MNDTQLFDFLSDRPYVIDIHDLPNLEYMYDPNTVWQQSGHVNAWVDIIGYEDMIFENETFYILENDSAIVKFGYDHTIRGQNWWNYNVDELKGKLVSVEFEDGKVTATIEVYLKYHHSKLVTFGDPPKKKIKKTYYDETHIFTVTDANPPKLYPEPDLTNIFAHAIFYNNSVSPKTVVAVDTIPHISGIEYKYDGETATYYPTVYVVMYTDKGCPYGTVISANIWRQNNENKAVFHVHDVVLVKAGQVDFDLLNVSVLKPRGKQQVAINTTEEKIRYEPPDNTDFYSILGMLVAIIFFLRRI